MSENTHNVYEAWSEVMREVRAIAVDQTGTGISYKFRGVNQVLDAFGPVLRKHGVVVYPSTASAACRDFTNKQGNVQHEAIVTVGYTVVGPLGDSFTGQVVGGSADSSDKAVPQAMSVALRTFFLQAGCVPTDDPEPDLNAVERQNAAEGEAHAFGWTSAAMRDEAWGQGVARMKALDPEVREAVVAWGKSLDPKLSKETLTPESYQAWCDEMAPAPTDVAASLLDVIAPEDDDPPTDDFDRAEVWAALHEWHGQLASQERFDKIERWIEANDISDDTLTREQAETWRAGMEGQPLKEKAATTDAKAQGWKSKAERERTFTSLTERTASLPESVQSVRTVIASFTEHFTKDTLTKRDATDWLALIEEGMAEPY